MQYRADVPRPARRRALSARSASLLAAALMIASAACGDATGPRASALRTDANSYTAVATGGGDFEVRVVVTYRNAADTAVGLDRCTPADSFPVYSVPVFVPLDPEGSAYDGPWACLGEVPPLVVAAGGMRVDTIVLHGPTTRDHYTHQGYGVLAGTFKIAYGGQASNPFTIRLPAGGN